MDIADGKGKTYEEENTWYKKVFVEVQLENLGHYTTTPLLMTCTCANAIYHET